MILKSIRPATIAVFALLLMVSAHPALAYAGPGLGLSALATAFGVVAALVLGLVSIVWFPIKRLVRKIRGNGARGRSGT